jgi:molybdate transport system substrate-binding protein
MIFKMETEKAKKEILLIPLLFFLNKLFLLGKEKVWLHNISALAYILIIFILCGCSKDQPEETTVAAAANLQSAFTEIGRRFSEETGHKVTFSFSSSGNLAQQIINGAPFDIFASADTSYVDKLEAQGLLLPNSKQIYAQGQIVLAVNKKSGLKVTQLNDLLNPQVRKIAIANPEHAPYGEAAMQALQKIGLWEQLQPKIVYGENVLQALQFVKTGNAEAGIVPLSIANVEEITYTIVDASLHEPINQAMAIIKTTKHQAVAKAFTKFVNSSQGRVILEQYGYKVP